MPVRYDFRKMSESEVARALKITRQTIIAWLKEGCPCVRDGKRVWCDLAQVHAWRVERAEQSRRRDDSEARQVDEEYRRLCEQLGTDTVPDAMDPYLGQGDSYYLELGRKRTAEKIQMANAAARGEFEAAAWASVSDRILQAAKDLRADLRAVGGRHGRQVGADIEAAIQRMADRHLAQLETEEAEP